MQSLLKNLFLFHYLNIFGSQPLQYISLAGLFCHLWLLEKEFIRLLSRSLTSVSLQLTKMNAEAQRVERELRDELANSISKAVSSADRAKIAELEKAEAELRLEVSKCV